MKFNFKAFAHDLAKVTAYAAGVVAVQQIQSGAPLTSGNVLIPALSAAAAAAVKVVLADFFGIGADPAPAVSGSSTLSTPPKS